MQEAVRKRAKGLEAELATADENRKWQLFQTGEGVREILNEAAWAWAKRKGLKEVVSRMVPEIRERSILVFAVEGAIIDILPYTAYLICRYIEHKGDDEMIWESYAHGEEARLLGTYVFRIRRDGRATAPIKRKIASNQKELRLPISQGP